MKIPDYFLNEKEIKLVMKISKHAVVNQIKDGRVGNKYTELICENQECEANYDLDIPNHFDLNDNDKIVCSYCKEIYKDDFRGRESYILGLKSDDDLGPLAEKTTAKITGIKE